MLPVVAVAVVVAVFVVTKPTPVSHAVYEGGRTVWLV